MKKFIVIFCFVIILLHLFQIIYSQRALFTQGYDVPYWKDRFEHSQWVLPLSKRIIGDDGLFAYMGHDLANGGSLSGFDSEVPPLGKYFIGLSIKTFNNPLYYSIFFGLGSLALFYMIGIRIFRNKVNSLLAVSVLFLDPLFFSQFWQSALDIYQLFFLLAHVLFITYLINKKTDTDNKCIFYVLMSGFCLGLFAEVKFPILLPLILVIESIFFILRRTRREYLLYLVSLGSAILIVNIKFFLDGNSIIDFLGFQKYILFFYLKSQLVVNYGAIWQTLFSGNFPSVSSRELSRINEWWIAWPIISIVGLLASILFVFKKRTPLVLKGLGLFILGSLFILTIIPFYPRYMVIILPFLYLVAIKFVQPFFDKKKLILCLILLLFGFINSFFFLLPKPESSLNVFYYNLSHLYFHDIYQENIANNNVLGLTRSQFRYIANKAFDDGKIKGIDVKELNKNISVFSAKGDVRIGLTYITQDLGSFYEEKVVKLVQDDGKWKIKWDWNIILNGFSPEYRIESQIIAGKRGSIINNSNGVYLARDIDGYLLSVNPEKIDLKRERVMLETFFNYGYRGDVNFQNAYLENVLPNSFVPIMTLSQKISPEEKSLFLSYPGIVLTPYMSRIFAEIDAESIENNFYKECCTRIYSSYNYHGVKGFEQKYDKVLWGYSGGRILIKDNKGAIIKVVVEKNKRDGKDVIL